MATAIRTVEVESRQGETQVFIETPYRNAALFSALLQNCQSTTRLAVAVALTGGGQFVRQQTISEWQARPADAQQAVVRQPAVFCLLA